MSYPATTSLGELLRRKLELDNMNSEKPVPFWIVWCPDGATPPKHCHTSEAFAEDEARRLARVNPGKVFFVMRAVSRSAVSAIQTINF